MIDVPDVQTLLVPQKMSPIVRLKSVSRGYGKAPIKRTPEYSSNPCIIKQLGSLVPSFPNAFYSHLML